MHTLLLARRPRRPYGQILPGSTSVRPSHALGYCHANVVVVAVGSRCGFWPKFRLPVNVFVANGVSRSMQGAVSTTQPHVGGDAEARVEYDAYEIYERHYREMVGLAQSLVSDVATAEDIVHDATIRLHGSLQRVRDPDRVLAYYRSIVLNLARNQMRRRGRSRAAEQRLRARTGDELIHHDVRRPERAAVLSAVVALPRRQQECVLLRHYSDLDERSIADTLGISVGSVKKHLHRASVRLATTLKEFS